MSVSQSFLSDQIIVTEVIDAYLSSDKPTIKELAAGFQTSYSTVQYIVSEGLTPERYKAEKALRYSRSKMGEKNPMSGKSGSQHHNHIGDIDDGYGYLQRKVNGKYEFVHRLVMAEALGLEKLPDWAMVHHIDENPHNNTLDNLALVTKAGHVHLHQGFRSPRLTLWEEHQFGTSKLMETTLT